MLRNISLLLFIFGVCVVFSYGQGLQNLDIVGTWKTGGMSMMADRNTVTGATTPSNGSTFKYEFKPNGKFGFTGYLQSTVYGCSTMLFNEKQGVYDIDGYELTLRPTVNFWRKSYSCSPGSNREQNYTLETEKFTISGKRDEYGNGYLCLTNAKGETCYRNEDDRAR